MKHVVFRSSFLFALLAALLLSAGDASAHGIDLHAEADAAAHDGAAERTSPPEGEITVDMAALEDMIARVLDEKLARRHGDGPELRDVVGGIGWILGLLGLAAYMKYRSRAQG